MSPIRVSERGITLEFMPVANARRRLCSASQARSHSPRGVERRPKTGPLSRWPSPFVVVLVSTSARTAPVARSTVMIVRGKMAATSSFVARSNSRSAAG